jgi:hypothetical protein
MHRFAKTLKEGETKVEREFVRGNLEVGSFQGMKATYTSESTSSISK